MWSNRDGYGYVGVVDDAVVVVLDSNVDRSGRSVGLINCFRIVPTKIKHLL